jgi:hypothetical protein
MLRRTDAACALVALLAGCAASPVARTAPIATVAVATPSAAPVAPPTILRRDTSALDELSAAVRSFIERGERHPLVDMMADDLRVRSGRAHEVSAYDSTYGKARLVALDGWAANNEVKSTLRIVSPHFVSTGHSATVEWSTILTRVDDGELHAFGESYRLELRDGAWKIVKFEYWPLLPDTLKEFDAQFWADEDAKIDEARASGDARQLAYELMVGYRFDECVEVSRRLTAETPNDPWVWGMRATASALVGDQVDAERASAEKRRLETQPAPASSVTRAGRQAPDSHPDR